MASRLAIAGPSWYLVDMTTTHPPTLGAIVTRARHRAGLSQQEVADAIGVSRTTYRQWESDGAIPAARSIGALADVLPVSVDALVRAAQRAQ